MSHLIEARPVLEELRQIRSVFSDSYEIAEALGTKDVYEGDEYPYWEKEGSIHISGMYGRICQLIDMLESEEDQDER